MCTDTTSPNISEQKWFCVCSELIFTPLKHTGISLLKIPRRFLTRIPSQNILTRIWLVWSDIIVNSNTDLVISTSFALCTLCHWWRKILVNSKPSLSLRTSAITWQRVFDHNIQNGGFLSWSVERFSAQKLWIMPHVCLRKWVHSLIYVCDFIKKILFWNTTRQEPELAWNIAWLVNGGTTIQWINALHMFSMIVHSVSENSAGNNACKIANFSWCREFNSR